MRPKIRCDEKCEKFCKIFWEVNKALAYREDKKEKPVSVHLTQKIW